MSELKEEITLLLAVLSSDLGIKQQKIKGYMHNLYRKFHASLEKNAKLTGKEITEKWNNPQLKKDFLEYINKIVTKDEGGNRIFNFIKGAEDIITEQFVRLWANPNTFADGRFSEDYQIIREVFGLGQREGQIAAQEIVEEAAAEGAQERGEPFEIKRQLSPPPSPELPPRQPGPQLEAEPLEEIELQTIPPSAENQINRLADSFGELGNVLSRNIANEANRGLLNSLVNTLPNTLRQLAMSGGSPDDINNRILNYRDEAIRIAQQIARQRNTIQTNDFTELINPDEALNTIMPAAVANNPAARQYMRQPNNNRLRRLLNQANVGNFLGLIGALGVLYKASPLLGALVSSVFGSNKKAVKEVTTDPTPTGGKEPPTEEPPTEEPPTTDAPPTPPAPSPAPTPAPSPAPSPAPAQPTDIVEEPVKLPTNVAIKETTPDEGELRPLLNKGLDVESDKTITRTPKERRESERFLREFRKIEKKDNALTKLEKEMEKFKNSFFLDKMSDRGYKPEPVERFKQMEPKKEMRNIINPVEKPSMQTQIETKAGVSENYLLDVLLKKYKK